ncbi:hypothetical protein CEW91_00155 [Idiomarina piscisalsi]|uniref:Porin domain-containing protein n=1 Tax=Idiomarina piscisalsi TaxID=1096243 RepID=A0ABM6LQ54_9GAMM|nr:hypothetical protein [Idiomarina piscisalsi]ASG64664.1 hypothetical protein CEW91_00155 [Idiomarina piscisalsi]
MKYSLLASISASALVMSSSALAQDQIEWSGFGSIAAGMTTGSDDQLFGYDNDLDFNPGSLFALQAKANLSDKLSVTTQIMSRGSEDFDLGVEWAYLQYQLTDSASVNVGKLRLPFYMYSDYLDVGYSYHWLRTPQSVYRVPFDNYTGVSFQHNAFVGDFTFNTQIVAGNMQDDISVIGGETAEAELNNLIGFNTSAIYSNLTMRVAYYQTNDANIQLRGIDGDVDALLTLLEQVGADQIITELDASEDKGTFAGVGVMYDNFDWFVGAEYTELELENSYVPKQRSAYITAGKRFDSWALHATYGKTDDKVMNPERFAVPDPQLQAVVNQAANIVVTETAYSSIGVNVNIAPSAVLKFDVTHADNKLTDESDVLASAAVQFVF